MPPIEELQNEEQEALSAKLENIYDRLATTLARDISTWGGTAVTGRDISTDLAKLDIALSALRDAIVNGTTPTDLLAVKNEITTLLGTQKNRSAWTRGTITVPTAGTPVQGPNMAVPDGFAVSLIYHPKNTGDIGVAESSAAANLSTGDPTILSGAGQGFDLKVTNLNLIWVDASVSGEKLMYVVEQ